MVEYAPNKLLITTYPNNNMIVDDWKAVHLVVHDGSIAANTQKFWLAPLPGFHEKDFPFFVCSGLEKVELINVKTKSAQILVHAGIKNVHAQQAIFFQKEQNGFKMHFCTIKQADDNKEHHNWYCMSFKEDFKLKLAKYGALPNQSLKSHFSMAKQLKDAAEECEQHKQQLEEQ